MSCTDCGCSVPAGLALASSLSVQWQQIQLVIITQSLNVQIKLAVCVRPAPTEEHKYATIPSLGKVDVMFIQLMHASYIHSQYTCIAVLLNKGGYSPYYRCLWPVFFCAVRFFDMLAIGMSADSPSSQQIAHDISFS